MIEPSFAEQFFGWVFNYAAPVLVGLVLFVIGTMLIFACVLVGKELWTKR